MRGPRPGVRANLEALGAECHPGEGLPAAVGVKGGGECERWGTRGGQHTLDGGRGGGLDKIRNHMQITVIFPAHMSGFPNTHL